MRYHYRIWCSDCLGSDPQGCFDGGVLDDEQQFATPQEANRAGWHATLRSILEYEVVDEDGTVIEVEEPPWEEQERTPPLV